MEKILMPEKMALATSLSLLRKEQKYSQQQVADYVGVDRSTYAAYEIARNTPNVFILDRIAKLYGISIDSILHNSDLKKLTKGKRT